MHGDPRLWVAAAPVRAAAHSFVCARPALWSRSDQPFAWRPTTGARRQCGDGGHMLKLALLLAVAGFAAAYAAVFGDR